MVLRPEGPREMARRGLFIANSDTDGTPLVDALLLSGEGLMLGPSLALDRGEENAWETWYPRTPAEAIGRPRTPLPRPPSGRKAIHTPLLFGRRKFPRHAFSAGKLPLQSTPESRKGLRLVVE
jgi:hypothetical protein